MKKINIYNDYFDTYNIVLLVLAILNPILLILAAKFETEYYLFVSFWVLTIIILFLSIVKIAITIPKKKEKLLKLPKFLFYLYSCIIGFFIIFSII